MKSVKTPVLGPRQPMRVCIVVPTYNEAGNIRAHLDRIFAVARAEDDFSKPRELQVLVVDDSSPDGTGKIVTDYAKEDPRVSLLTRTEKEGLGAAYIAGFMHALEHLNPDVIVEMDADGQHDPKDLDALLDEVEKGADFVIGSRYVNGGNIAEGWSVHRKVTSMCARTLTKALLNLGNVHDCSGGYRAIRAELLRRIDLPALKVRGYAFQAVLLEAAIYHGGVVREVPIRFGVRSEGKSKMQISDMMEGGFVCLRVRTKRLFSPAKRKRQGVRLSPSVKR